MNGSLWEEKYKELEKEYKKIKRQNELLQEYEQIYRVALGMTTNTVTVVDIPNRTLNQIYNEGILTGEWDGVYESMPDAPESIIATGIIHQEDCDEFRRFYNEIYEGRPYVEGTIRVMGETQGWVWFNMYSKTMYDEEGRPEKAIVFSDDITKKKIAEIQYLNYRDVVSERADFIWEANLTKDCMMHEDKVTVEFFTGANFKTYSGISDRAFSTVPDSHRELVKKTFSRNGLLQAYGKAMREVSLEYPFEMAGSGETIWLRSTAYMTNNYEGEICAIICSRDISKAKKREEELRTQAQKDPLCGLYNRRYFMEKVQDVLTTRKNERPVLLIMDVDAFKSINDRYGHSFGDKVLIQVANVMKCNFRYNDIIARIGGDEYMVLLNTGITKEGIESKLDGILSQLKNIKTPLGDTISINISTGSTEYIQGDLFDDMYTRADKALYKAKKLGKSHYIDFAEI